MKEVFHPQLVIVDQDAENRHQAIMQLADLLLQHDYVKKTFAQAVVDREAVFATGLPTKPFNVALPHTACEHVRKTGIAVGVLRAPVRFGLMGAPGESVEARIVFLLAIKDPDEQIQTLKALVDLFHKPSVLQNLMQAEDSKAVVKLINNSFGIQEFK